MISEKQVSTETEAAFRNVAVVVGADAPELEQFAAQELCGYLGKLFDIETSPVTEIPADAEAVFLVGTPVTNAAVASTPVASAFDGLAGQGLLLKRTEAGGKPALVLGGGSSRATMWAVYELVERWGVRYLTDRDALPEKRDAAPLPALDVEMTPDFEVRAHPTIQDFACSGEAWGIKDFRILLNQLAKLKYSRVMINAFGWQPYLHWECKGVERSSHWLWYDDHYPLTPEMPGRELFDGRPEFWNPDLPLGGTYQENAVAGEKLVRGLIDHAKARGLETSVYADLTQFTPEFAPLLTYSQTVHQVGELTVVPGPETELHDKNYFDLASSLLKAALNTYPDVDLIMVSMPEWRQWVGMYEEAWAALDKRYGVSEFFSLEEVIAAAENRQWGRGEGEYGTEKARDEVKGDLALLYFYDGLLHNPDVVGQTKRPDIKFMYHGIAEELFPVLNRLLPPGTELGTIVDNYPTKILQRRGVLEKIPDRSVPSVMDVTIDDDNVGIVPQLSTHILHEILKDLRQYGWAGFVARERFPADHDSAIAYLGRAGWDANATPDGVIADQIRAICGEDCIEDMQTVFREVELATGILETTDCDFAFPLPGMAIQFWDGRCWNFATPGEGPELPHIVEVKEYYQRALDAAARAYAKVAAQAGERGDKPEGEDRHSVALRYTGFWIGRTEFAIRYMESMQQLRRSGHAYDQGDREEAIRGLEEALVTMRSGLESYARVARNPTDLGTIALVYEHGYRTPQRKLAELRAEQQTELVPA